MLPKVRLFYKDYFWCMAAGGGVGEGARDKDDYVECWGFIHRQMLPHSIKISK